MYRGVFYVSIVVKSLDKLSESVSTLSIETLFAKYDFVDGIYSGMYLNNANMLNAISPL